jgi:DNA-binding transcriptional ArsR family regulator
MKSIDAVKALGALAQETRLAIFRLLVERGPAGMTAGKIAAALDVVPATLSFHFKELSAAGMLDARTEGRYIYYSARFDHMNELLAFLTANCCGGNPCISGLGASAQITCCDEAKA